MILDDKARKEFLVLQKAARLLSGKNNEPDPKRALSVVFNTSPEKIFGLKVQATQGFSDLFYLLHTKDFRRTDLYDKLFDIYDKDEEALVFVQGIKDQVHIVAPRNSLPKDLPLLVSFDVGPFRLELTEVKLLKSANGHLSEKEADRCL